MSIYKKIALGVGVSIGIALSIRKYENLIRKKIEHYKMLNHIVSTLLDDADVFFFFDFFFTDCSSSIMTCHHLFGYFW